MPLSPVIEKVVLHWGEMGARWGVNRSVAQIHALLWLTGRPMSAEEIAEALGIARSNVSTSLDELQTYRLATLVHVIGDRRNFYESKGDTWDVVQTIVDERKKREIDPTLDVLRAARDLSEDDPETPPDVRRRVNEMLSFIERMTGWYEQMRRVPRPTLQRIIKLGSGIVRLISK
jgi:DNA-binding transcriptional regulator GbsR (MarR family)